MVLFGSLFELFETFFEKVQDHLTQDHLAFSKIGGIDVSESGHVHFVSLGGGIRPQMSKGIRRKNSLKISSKNSAGNSAGHSNCLLDLYNARASLNFFNLLFAPNFDPVKKLKKSTFRVSK